MITRAEATEQILAAKQSKGLTFEAIAAAVGRHQVAEEPPILEAAPLDHAEARHRHVDRAQDPLRRKRRPADVVLCRAPVDPGGAPGAIGHPDPAEARCPPAAAR